MPSFAGIVYPNAFEMSNLVETISATFLESPSSQPFRFFRYKSVEMGSWNISMSSNTKKSIWAMLHGAVINQKEVGEELKSLGIQLTTEEAAEVIAVGYETWGIEALLEKINGPFALALFDERREELYLAVDRMGQRSIYWTLQGEHFLFSTEIKGLIASGIVPQVPSNSAFSSYLYFGFIPQDFSAIEGVNKLVPGHYLRIDLKRQLAVEQYWSLSQILKENQEIDLADARLKLGEYLDKATSRVTETTPSIGTYLHDDLGSDLITWLLSHRMKRDQITTYTTFLADEESSTFKQAAKLAKTLGVQHKTEQISVDQALDELPRILWHLDEPLADPGMLQVWHLGTLLASRQQTLLLDLGWQELMAGHAHYFYHRDDLPPSPHIAYKLAHLPSSLRDRFLFPLLRVFSPRLAFRVLRNIQIDREQIEYLSKIALFNGENRRRASPFLFRYFDPEVFTQRFHHLASAPERVSAALYYDLKTALPNQTLMQYTRLLSPHGIQSFSPYLDNDVVQFCATLPKELQFSENAPGAVILSLWRELTGSEGSCQPKPLIAPKWSNHLRLRNLFRRLEKGRLVEEGVISARWLHEMNQPKVLTDIAFRELWAILILEIWFHLFINRPIAMTDHEVDTETLLNG